jgi:predicted nucleic acid-binding protein
VFNHLEAHDDFVCQFAFTPLRETLSSEDEETECAAFVAAKNARVIAAARASGAAYLVSLDRKYIVTDQVRASIKPMAVLTPAEFIQRIRSMSN